MRLPFCHKYPWKLSTYQHFMSIWWTTNWTSHCYRNASQHIFFFTHSNYLSIISLTEYRFFFHSFFLWHQTTGKMYLRTEQWHIQKKLIALHSIIAVWQCLMQLNEYNICFAIFQPNITSYNTNKWNRSIILKTKNKQTEQHDHKSFVLFTCFSFFVFSFWFLRWHYITSMYGS